MTFMNLPLPPTTSNPHTVYHITLLGLVAKATGLVGPGWTRRPVDGFELTELPAPHTEEEAKQVGLLLTPQLLKILVRTHGLPSNGDKTQRSVEHMVRGNKPA